MQSVSRVIFGLRFIKIGETGASASRGLIVLEVSSDVEPGDDILSTSGMIEGTFFTEETFLLFLRYELLCLLSLFTCTAS